MNGEVLQFRKTADVSVYTLRIFLNEKLASRNFCSLWSTVLECDVHMQIINQNQQQIDKILKKHGVQFAYIFGSFVNGNAIKTSDIDIAVFLKEKNKLKRFNVRLNLMTDLGKILHKEIDLIVINDISSIFFKYVIFKEGKIIF